jgi:hypothetical protein
VDFTYRPTFFIMVAATSAFHRHLRRGLDELPEESTESVPAWRTKLQPVPILPQPMPALAMAGGGSLGSLQVRSESVLRGSSAKPAGFNEESQDGEEPPPVIPWKKIGLIDLGMMVASTWVVIRYWEHLINTM